MVLLEQTLHMGNKNCTGSFWANTVTWNPSTKTYVSMLNQHKKMLVWYKNFKSIDPIMDKSPAVSGGLMFSCTCLCPLWARVCAGARVGGRGMCPRNNWTYLVNNYQRDRQTPLQILTVCQAVMFSGCRACWRGWGFETGSSRWYSWKNRSFLHTRFPPNKAFSDLD